MGASESPVVFRTFFLHQRRESEYHTRGFLENCVYPINAWDYWVIMCVCARCSNIDGEFSYPHIYWTHTDMPGWYMCAMECVEIRLYHYDKFIVSILRKLFFVVPLYGMIPFGGVDERAIVSLGDFYRGR